jgi:hypothetical protein
MADATNFLTAVLPPGVRPLQVRRDFLLLEITLSPHTPQAQRVGILLDSDYDLRIASVLAALVIINRGECRNLIGLAESHGKIMSYWAGPPIAFIADWHAASLQEALKHAADAALFDSDTWEVEPPQFVAVLSDGKLDYNALDKDHPLRKIPARVPPGRVS